MGEGHAAIMVLLLLVGAIPGHADPGARAHFDAIFAGLDRLDAQIDAIAQQADRDAAGLIAGGAFAVRGDRGLAVELSRRPGAMQAYLGAEDGDVIYDSGVSEDDPALRAARAWVYQVELFAACTRRGRTPVIRMSPEIDTRRRRLLRYGSQPFHHDQWPTAPVPGVLGRAYLQGLRTVLRDIRTASWDALSEAAHRARAARSAGAQVHVVTGSSMLAYHLPQPFKPWSGSTADGDVVLAIGDFEQAGYHGDWPDLDAMRGGAGTTARVVWILNACKIQPADVRPGEIVVDLWAPFGDGVVRVDHYDARLGPVTGVAQLAVVHALARACVRDAEP